MESKKVFEMVQEIVRANVGSKRAERVLSSMEIKRGGEVVVYLSHGATLGEACDVQEAILAAGLQIPVQFGNAAIYVTE